MASLPAIRVSILIAMLFTVLFSVALPFSALSDTQSGYMRAEGRRAWSFPRDHGQHASFKLEWWYYTGILSTAEGRRFGYQVTFFRRGIAPPGRKRASAWGVQSLYLAHVALSDIAVRRFHRDSRVGRDGLGSAGASRTRLQVWLKDWRAEALQEDEHGVRLKIAANSFSLDLTLRSSMPPVLHGKGGLDRKGAAPGEASWYYSLPRLLSRGKVTIGGKAYQVQGNSWMDHEFGTGQLSPEIEGWDWLALHLDDGSALMLYRLRRRDGSPDEHSAGTLILTDGSAETLTLTGGGDHGARMESGRIWRSPANGAQYPLEWRISLPSHGLLLAIAPAFDAQEHAPGPGRPFAYWEGAVSARGTRDGRPLRGEGYLELTGYAGELSGALREGVR